MGLSIGGDSGVQDEFIEVSRQNWSRGDVRGRENVQRIRQRGKINLLFSSSSKEFRWELVRPLFGKGRR